LFFLSRKIIIQIKKRVDANMKLHKALCMLLGFCMLLAIVGVHLAITTAPLKADTSPVKDGKVKDGDTLGSEKGSLFYFLHITDFHISVFKESEWHEDLWTFYDDNMRVIKPNAVIASDEEPPSYPEMFQPILNSIPGRSDSLQYAVKAVRRARKLLSINNIPIKTLRLQDFEVSGPLSQVRIYLHLLFGSMYLYAC
jgi:hypothetical protein